MPARCEWPALFIFKVPYAHLHTSPFSKPPNAHIPVLCSIPYGGVRSLSELSTNCTSDATSEAWEQGCCADGRPHFFEILAPLLHRPLHCHAPMGHRSLPWASGGRVLGARNARRTLSVSAVQMSAELLENNGTWKMAESSCLNASYVLHGPCQP